MTPSVFNGVKVWRLSRPIQKLDILLLKPDLGSSGVILSFHSYSADTMFWIHAPTISPQATHSLASVDYDLLHCCMGHLLKDVLRAARKHLKDFPDVKIPSQDPICPGYQLGKQPNRSFPHTERRATVPFELIQYIQTLNPLRWNCITNINMPLSNMMIISLWHGSFVSDPRIRPSQPLNSSSPMSEHNIMLLSRAGDLMLAANLCMSKAFRYYLKDNGIHIHQSTPYTHQQNGCTE